MFVVRLYAWAIAVGVSALVLVVLVQDVRDTMREWRRRRDTTNPSNAPVTR